MKQKPANQVSPFGDLERKLLTTIEEKCEKNELDKTSSMQVPHQDDSLRWEDKLAEMINYQGSTGCVAIINDENNKELIIIDEKNYLSNAKESQSVRVFLSELQDSRKGKDDLNKSLSNICKRAMENDMKLKDKSEQMLRVGLISKEVNFTNLDDCHKELLEYLTKEYDKRYKKSDDTHGTQQEQEKITKECQKIVNSFTAQDKQGQPVRNFLTAVSLERQVNQYIIGCEIKQKKLDQFLSNRDKLKGYTVKYLDNQKPKSWNKSGIHPDVKAIEYLRDKDKLEKQQVYYIGITMPPCIPCDISIRVINKENEGKWQIAARQTDGRYFPNWSRFAHLEDNVNNRKSFENFQKELAQCAANPEQYFRELRPSFQDLKRIQNQKQQAEIAYNTSQPLKDDEKHTVTAIWKKGQSPQTKTTTTSNDKLGDSDNEQHKNKRATQRSNYKRKRQTKTSDYKKQEQKIEELKKSSSSLKDEAKRLETEKKRYEDELKKYESKFQEATQQIQSELTQAERNIQEARQNISAVKSNIANSFGNENENNKLLSAWNSALISRMQHQASLDEKEKSLVARNNTTLKNIRKNIDKCKHDISTVKQEIATTEREIEASNQALHAYQQKQDTSRAQSSPSSSIDQDFADFKTTTTTQAEQGAKAKVLQNKIPNESQKQQKAPRSQTSKSSLYSLRDTSSEDLEAAQKIGSEVSNIVSNTPCNKSSAHKKSPQSTPFIKKDTKTKTKTKTR